jgi:hypothetical protein
MKALFFIICLVLSLPNLLAGLALAVLQRTFATRNPLQIIFDFVDSVAWGLPSAALVLLLLVVASFFSATRPYAAICALVLNLAALVLFLITIRPPEDLWEAVFFLPVLIALIGFAWLSYDDLSLKWRKAI